MPIEILGKIIINLEFSSQAHWQSNVSTRQTYFQVLMTEKVNFLKIIIELSVGGILESIRR